MKKKIVIKMDLKGRESNLGGIFCTNRCRKTFHQIGTSYHLSVPTMLIFYWIRQNWIFEWGNWRRKTVSWTLVVFPDPHITQIIGALVVFWKSLSPTNISTRLNNQTNGPDNGVKKNFCQIFLGSGDTAFFQNIATGETSPAITL